MAGRQSVKGRELYLEGELMAWSERQVSRPDLSCRKLFMSLNKMMLQLPMMNNLCVRVCVHALATEKVCEQYCSDRSQRALGRNPPQTHTPTPTHADIRIHTHPAMVSPLIIYHYLPQKRGERVTPKTVHGPYPCVSNMRQPPHAPDLSKAHTRVLNRNYSVICRAPLSNLTYMSSYSKPYLSNCMFSVVVFCFVF